MSPFILASSRANGEALPPLPSGAKLAFQENWSSGRVDSSQWYLLRKQWGTGNNSVVPENVAIKRDLVNNTGQKPLANATDAQVIEYKGFWWVQDKTIPADSYLGNPLKRLGKDEDAIYTGRTVQNRVDGKKVGGNSGNVPSMGAQLTMGVWLPGWGGLALWQTALVSFGCLKIWQYDEAGDVRGILVEDVPPIF